jgi:hypothetical protein
MNRRPTTLRSVKSSDQNVTERVVVLDDRSLRSVLLGTQPPLLIAMTRQRSAYTTGSWLYRLSQAVRSDGVGALSGPIASLPADYQTQVIEKIIELPSDIGLLSGRELAWTMAGLIQKHRLNYLSLEALATCVLTGGAMVLSEMAQSPLLVAACRIENVRVVFVE